MSKQMTHAEIEHDLRQLIQASEHQGKHIFQLMQRVNALEGRRQQVPINVSTIITMIAGAALGSFAGVTGARVVIYLIEAIFG